MLNKNRVDFPIDCFFSFIYSAPVDHHSTSVFQTHSVKNYLVLKGISEKVGLRRFV